MHQDRKGRRLTALLLPIGVLTVAAVTGAAFAPVLLVRAPIALIALNSQYGHLILASNSIGAAPFVAVAVARLFAPDPFFFLIGREYGAAAIEWIERRSPVAGRIARFVERLFVRAGPVLLFVVPAGLVCVLAGASRMRTRTFALINLSGTTTAVLMVRAFGHAFADPIESVRGFVEANIVVLTSFSIALVLVSTVVRRRRARLRVDRAAVIATEEPGER